MQHNYIITNIRFCQVLFCSLFLFFLHSLPFLSPHVRRRFTMRKHHFTRAAHFTCRKANLTEKTPAAYAAGVLYRHRSIFPSRRQPSIFDADELNFCVRYGNRWDLIAISTDSGHSPVFSDAAASHAQPYFRLFDKLTVLDTSFYAHTLFTPRQ